MNEEMNNVQERKKNRIITILMVVIILLILALIIVVVVKKSDSKSNEPSNPNTPVVDETDKPNEPSDDKEPSNPDENDKTNVQEKYLDNNKKYHMYDYFEDELEEIGDTSDIGVFKVAGKEVKIGQKLVSLLACGSYLTINDKIVNMNNGCHGTFSIFNNELIAIQVDNEGYEGMHMAFYDTAGEKVKEFGGYFIYFLDDKVIVFNSERNCQENYEEHYELTNMYVYQYKKGQFILKETVTDTNLNVEHTTRPAACIERES